VIWQCPPPISVALDVAAGELAEDLGAVVIEVYGDVGLVVLRVVGDERIFDRLAGDLGALEQVVRAVRVCVLALLGAVRVVVLGDRVLADQELVVLGDRAGRA
jgi:hypothetical protein